MIHNSFIKTKDFNFLSDIKGFWGNVSGIDEENLRVRVIACTGQEFIGLPVVSREWVCDHSSYTSGSRDLPPVGSRVFVLMPTGTITGAFVLCSGFAAGEKEKKKFIESTKSNNSKEIKRVSQGGWIEKENISQGSKTIESKNGNIKIDVDLTGNKVLLKVFNLTFKITTDKIELVEGDEIKLDIGSNKLSVMNGNSSLLEVTGG